MSNDIRDALCDAPDSQLDASMKPLIKAWDNPPKTLQILEVLDQCIHASLASGFVVTLLQGLYNNACKEEKTTHEEVILKAHWRNKT